MYRSVQMARDAPPFLWAQLVDEISKEPAFEIKPTYAWVIKDGSVWAATFGSIWKVFYGSSPELFHAIKDGPYWKPYTPIDAIVVGIVDAQGEVRLIRTVGGRVLYPK